MKIAYILVLTLALAGFCLAQSQSPDQNPSAQAGVSGQATTTAPNAQTASTPPNAVNGQASDQGAGQDMKNAAHDTAHATKKTAHKGVHAVKKGTHKAAHGVKKGAGKVEDKTTDQNHPPHNPQ